MVFLCDWIVKNLICFYLMKKNKFELYSGMKTDQNNEYLYWVPIDKLESISIAPKFLGKELIDIPDQVTHIISYE